MWDGITAQRLKGLPAPEILPINAMPAVKVPGPVTTLPHDCRRQMETMLALCVAYEVLWAPENFRAAFIRTIKRRLMPSEVFGSKMPCQAINTPWLFPLALS